MLRPIALDAPGRTDATDVHVEGTPLAARVMAAIVCLSRL